MTTDFSLTVSVDDDRARTIVAVRGDFDASRVAQFERRVGDMQVGVDSVEIDLRSATIVDSAGLGALIRLTDRLAATGITFRTVVARAYLVELLAITGLWDTLAVDDVTDTGEH